MQISAVVQSSLIDHRVSVKTDGASKQVAIPAHPSGQGSSINGGEFLMLAIATCYCNDLHREARRLGLRIDSVEVEATADFPGIALAATNIRYRARVQSSASELEIRRLLLETDAVAEVHNTVRVGVPVKLILE